MICLLLMTAALIFNYYPEKVEDINHPEKPIHVIAELVKYDSSYDLVTTLSMAQANESVDITIDESGKIIKFNFNDGQTVKRGDILVLMDQQEEISQLAAANAKLVNSKIELERLKKLLLRQAVAQQHYDDKESQLKVYHQKVRQIESKISKKVIRAPFDGVVGLRKLSEGAIVQAGQNILTISDLTKIKLDLSLPSKYLFKLTPKLVVKAESDALPDETFFGKVDDSQTVIDPKNHSVIARIRVDNNELRIKPGLLMKVSLIDDEKKILMISEESIFIKNSGHFVYLIEKDQDKVIAKNVEIGQRKYGRVEVKSGLVENDVIVKRGTMMLSNERKVIIDNFDQIEIK